MSSFLLRRISSFLLINLPSRLVLRLGELSLFLLRLVDVSSPQATTTATAYATAFHRCSGIDLFFFRDFDESVTFVFVKLLNDSIGAGQRHDMRQKEQQKKLHGSRCDSFFSGGFLFNSQFRFCVLAVGGLKSARHQLAIRLGLLVIDAKVK